jgi:hypothetical protein
MRTRTSTRMRKVPSMSWRKKKSSSRRAVVAPVEAASAERHAAVRALPRAAALALRALAGWLEVGQCEVEPRLADP